MKRSSLALTSFIFSSLFFLSACGDRGSRYDTLADTQPYINSGAYSSKLKVCATAETAIGSCSLNKLPTIAMEYPQPTIDNIMERLLVSHDWMGERFERLLENLPEDILQLLGAVTVIVIDDDVRPSYYHNVTGSIYLDPVNLWMSQDEKNVINRKQDHRAAYADPMSFRSYWRYSKDDGPAYKWHGFSSEEDRAFEDIIVPMAALLYHELAHANDILPKSNYNSIDRSKSIYSTSENLYDSYPSTALREDSPLQSKEMLRMASILFQGAKPTQADTEVTAAEMGRFFAPDLASDDYAYTSQYEDLAMLIEETMMKLHFDVDRDMAYIDYPGDDLPCNDHIVAWGVRNRIGEEGIKQRAQFVIKKILPDNDYSEFFNTLNPPSPLRNVGWCESRQLEASVSAKGKLQIQSLNSSPLNLESMERLYKIHEH